MERVLAWRTGAPPQLFGNTVWVAFVSVQAADAVLTYLGIIVFGIGMEANPIVAGYLAALGPSTGLVCVKLLAISCAAFLHCLSRHRVVGVLTIGLLVAAIGPWVELLWP